MFFNGSKVKQDFVFLNNSESKVKQRVVLLHFALFCFVLFNRKKVRHKVLLCCKCSDAIDRHVKCLCVCLCVYFVCLIYSLFEKCFSNYCCFYLGSYKPQLFDRH